jgi:hypothetical protein
MHLPPFRTAAILFMIPIVAYIALALYVWWPWPWSVSLAAF